MTSDRDARGGSDYWNAVGESWRRRSPDRLWRSHSDAVNRGLLERWLPAEGRRRILKTDLFDEATGDGLIEVLRERFPAVLGIDVSHGVIRTARERNAEQPMVRCDVRALPFRNAAFTAIVSISTLDHFLHASGIADALRELHRILTPGGQLLLTLDNRANPIVAIRNLLPFRLTHALGLLPYYVGHTAGPWSARRLLAESGFDVVESDTVMHCPRVLAVPLSRILERRRGAAKAWFLRALLVFERLRGWPTAPWTGHFVALRAIRR